MISAVTLFCQESKPTMCRTSDQVYNWDSSTALLHTDFPDCVTRFFGFGRIFFRHSSCRTEWDTQISTWTRHEDSHTGCRRITCLISFSTSSTNFYFSHEFGDEIKRHNFVLLCFVLLLWILVRQFNTPSSSNHNHNHNQCLLLFSSPKDTQGSMQYTRSTAI